MLTAFDINSFYLLLSETVILSVVATDGGGLMGYANVTITVGDLNDNAPRFDQSIYTFTVIEEEMDAFVGSVVATDMDDLENGEVCECYCVHIYLCICFDICIYITTLYICLAVFAILNSHNPIKQLFNTQCT